MWSSLPIHQFSKEGLDLKQALKSLFFTCLYPAVSADHSSRFHTYHIDRQIPFPVRCSTCHSHSQWFCVIFPDSHHLLMTGDSVKGALWWRKWQQQTQFVGTATSLTALAFLSKQIFMEVTPRHFPGTWHDGRHDSLRGLSICRQSYHQDNCFNS